MFEILFLELFQGPQCLVYADSHFFAFSQKLSRLDNQLLYAGLLDIFNQTVELTIQKVEFVLISEYLKRLYQIFPEAIDVIFRRVGQLQERTAFISKFLEFLRRCITFGHNEGLISSL